MLNNFPLSHKDQVKLIKDGWTLVQASKKHKMIITVTPDGLTKTKGLDTQIDVGIRANYIADKCEKHFVSIDGNVRKPSINTLIKDGYTIIRPRKEVSTIFYCSAFGSWRALERVDADRSLELAMAERLMDSKTIRC